MKTIQAIVELTQTGRPGSVFAMATVVKVRGSAYRRPGARMVMMDDGQTAGMISGGCLEHDVRTRARTVIDSGRPALVTYDSTAPEDVIFGLGLGCNGIVQVLIEPFLAGEVNSLPAFLTACVARRQMGRVATLFPAEPAPPISRVLRWPDGRVTSSCPDPEVAAALLQMLHVANSGRNAVFEINLPDGSAAGVLVESIAPPIPLTIFGAGDDAIPLAAMAKALGWQVTVIDARPAYATAARFPGADAIVNLRPELLRDSPQVVFPPESMVVIMTHQFLQDREVLRALLPRELRYLGILGPKNRTRRLLDDLGADGLIFSEDQLAGLRAPAGLDIGAETPEEIAVSILAEMQSVLARRSGGPLCERQAPIHDPGASFTIA